MSLVTRSQLKDMTGVSRQTVAATLKKPENADAVDEHGMIDITHKGVAKWLKSRGYSVSAEKKRAKKKNIIDEEKYVDNLRDRTIGEIEAGNGDLATFERILKMLELRDKVKLRRLDVEERAGNLVPRVLVERGVFTLIEDLLTRLTVDAPSALSNSIKRLTKTETSSEVIRNEIHDVISRHIKGAKKQAVDALKF